MTEVPKHVGLIPDGTRRWARLHAVPLHEAYHRAFVKLAGLTDRLFERDVSAVSLFFLSRRNLQRDPSELEAALRAEQAVCRNELGYVASRYGAKVLIAGRMAGLPPWYVEALETLQDRTRSNTARQLYLCAGYDPLDELREACRRWSNGEVGNLFDGLWVPEPIDLVIRTACVRRLSDFLPLQAGYAELEFVEPLFNDFTEADLDRALDRFGVVERRLGG